MTDITVARRSSDGRGTTYCVTISKKADRTRHDVVIAHNEIYDFADHASLLTFVFERLLEKSSKEEIRSSFRLKDLLAYEADLRNEVEGYRFMATDKPMDQGWVTA